MPSSDYLVWIDLEMTGLKPDTDVIIEMATIVTDANLNLVSEGPVIAIHQPDPVLDAMDDWNKRTHGASGLITRVRESKWTMAMAESRGTTTIARIPRARAASATAVPWLPEECVITSGVRAGSSCNSTFMAPRYLNAPPVCRFSHLKNTRCPTRASKAAERMTGVRTTCGPIRPAAATTSANVVTTVRSRQLTARREQLSPVILELADGFADVGERLVLALLHESPEHAGRPAPRQFLERAHVEIAVVKEFLERRHVAREKAPVLADAVAAHG
jgi:hypothetical protein